MLADRVRMVSSKKQGMWVLVGNKGKISISYDGIEWIAVSSGISEDIFCIEYGNGTWVAGSRDGNILISTDGINWVQRSIGLSVDIQSVLYVDGMWLIGASNGRIYTSTDLITWVKRETYHGNRINKLAYGNGLYVGVSYFGYALTSTDGINWASNILNLPVAKKENLLCIAFGKDDNGVDTWAIGDAVGRIFVSQDFSYWGNRGQNLEPDSVYTVAYGENGGFIAAGGEGKLVYSDNGGYSNFPQDSSFVGTDIRSVYYANKLWVAVGDSSKLATSINGVDWVQRDSKTKDTYVYRLNDVKYGGE